MGPAHEEFTVWLPRQMRSERQKDGSETVGIPQERPFYSA